MDPFGYDADQYAAAAAWASVAVLFVTGIVIVAQLRHAQGLRRDQSRPYVVPQIAVEQEVLFVFAVENIGRTAAHDVRITFDPPVQSKDFPKLPTIRMLNEPIPTMPPGQRFRANWERTFVVFGEKGPYELPMSYEVTVQYRGMNDRSLAPEKYILDFSVYEGQNRGIKGLPELVRATQELVTEHKKWTLGASGGLAVHTRDAERDQRRQNRSWHFRRSAQAGRDEGWRAAARHWIELWRRRYGYWSG